MTPSRTPAASRRRAVAALLGSEILTALAILIGALALGTFLSLGLAALIQRYGGGGAFDGPAFLEPDHLTPVLGVSLGIVGGCVVVVVGQAALARWRAKRAVSTKNAQSAKRTV